MMRKYNKKAFKLKYKITAPRIISKEESGEESIDEDEEEKED